MSQNNRGFSLIEILVAVGVGLTMLFVFTTIILNQQKELRRLSVKAEVLDLGRSLRTSLSKSNICLYNLGSGGALDLSLVPTSGAPLASPIVSPAVIRDGDTSTSPILLAAGGPVPGIPGLSVESMELTNWLNLATDSYKADLVVKFLSSLGPIAPLTIRQLRLKTTGVATSAKTITSCDGPGGAGGGKEGWYSDYLAGTTIVCSVSNFTRKWQTPTSMGSCNNHVANGVTASPAVVISARVNSDGTRDLQYQYAAGPYSISPSYPGTLFTISSSFDSGWQPYSSAISAMIPIGLGGENLNVDIVLDMEGLRVAGEYIEPSTGSCDFISITTKCYTSWP